MLKWFNLFFKRKISPSQIQEPEIEQERLNWNGSNFEFLIRFEDNKEPTIPDGKLYDAIMTPNSMQWVKIVKDGCDYYRVGDDEYSYSWEMIGIQMVFNAEVSYIKAHKIVYEIINNLRYIGTNASLIIVDKSDNRPIVF